MKTIDVTSAHIAAASLVSQHLTSPADVRLIAALLDVASGETVPAQTVTAAQYDLLTAHRVVTLIPQDWVVPTDRDLAGDKRRLATQQLILLDIARTALESLAAAGIDARVLKGAASCDLDYPMASQRTIGDIDLLVEPADFEASIEVIGELGASAEPVGPSGYEFVAGAALTFPAGHEIDLHYRLRRTSPAVAELFGDPVSLPGSGLALHHDARLVHAACHLMLSTPGARRLSGLADISAIRSRHPIDLERVRHLARLLGCEALCGTGLQAERTLRGLDVDTADWEQPNALERAAYARSSNRIVAQYLYDISIAEGIRAKFRLVRYRLVPTAIDSVRRRGIFHVLGRATPSELGGRGLDEQR